MTWFVQAAAFQQKFRLSLTAKGRYIAKIAKKNILEKEPLFPRPFKSAPFSKGLPSLREGEIAQKNVPPQRLSLEELRAKAPVPARETRPAIAATFKKKDKAAPDLAGLREALGKITDEPKEEKTESPKKPEEAPKNGGVLKSGDSIKF